ncbi:MAG: sterol desaturase family protein [Rhodospirillales bacterium]|nr:sterol desaturase family protein [Rhodospirillales bacterium]
MGIFIFANEMVIRLGCFAAVLATMVAWELRLPRRAGEGGLRMRRWRANLGLVALDTVILRVLFPLAAVGAALMANDRGWGLFNAVAAPPWLAVGLSLVILDLAIYAQHVAFHKIALLWRLHRVHHTDVALDATTGLRFHPIEIVASMLLKIALVTALGAPALAVVIFEVALNAFAMFNHSNVYLPRWVDARLRRLIVTPDMHRAHHSIHRDETDSNYGFNLSLWDRLFGTYRDQPRDGHVTMALGLDGFRDPREDRLFRLLVQPFLRDGNRPREQTPRQPLNLSGGDSTG